MKTIVCVAPDGSLEVWEFIERHWTFQSHEWLGFTVCDQFQYGPVFWGREILGEL